MVILSHNSNNGMKNTMLMIWSTRANDMINTHGEERETERETHTHTHTPHTHTYTPHIDTQYTRIYTYTYKHTHTRTQHNTRTIHTHFIGMYNTHIYIYQVANAAAFAFKHILDGCAGMMFDVWCMMYDMMYDVCRIVQLCS